MAGLLNGSTAMDNYKSEGGPYIERVPILGLFRALPICGVLGRRHGRRWLSLTDQEKRPFEAAKTTIHLVLGYVNTDGQPLPRAAMLVWRHCRWASRP